MEAVTYIDSLDEYQQRSQKTAFYPQLGSNLLYPSLKLAGEAGEVADKVGKLWRDKDTYTPQGLTSTDKTALLKELGDVMWYVAALATELDVNLSFVAGMNIDKLEDRVARGVIKGSGDNR